MEKSLKIYKIIILSIFLLIFIGESLSSANNTILKIEVTGNKRVEKEAILLQIKSKLNEPLSLSQIDKDIRNIYKLGFFKDVIVKIEKVKEGIILIFEVKEKPAISKINFSGNNEIDLDKIKEVITVKENSILDKNLIVESVQKIQKLYTDEGFYIAEVTYSLEEIGENEVELNFNINENQKVIIKKINIIGNKVFSDEEIKKVMTTKEGNPLSWLTDTGKYREDQFQYDMSLIEGLYKDNGYIQFQISNPQVFLSEDKKWVTIVFSVEEGVQYRVGKIDIRGDIIFDKEELKKNLLLKSGEVFNLSLYRKDNEYLTNKYQDKGFAFANVNVDDKVDNTKQLIDLTYNIQKGKLVYIEQIEIIGNYKTRDNVIRRELALKEGEIFDGPALKKSKERLMRLGFFEEVNVKKRMGSSDNKIIVTIEVKETTTGSLLLGAGFSSFDKYMFNAQISEQNFLGRGLRYQLQASFGQRTQTFILSVTEPRLFDSRWSLSGSIDNTTIEFSTYEQTGNSFSLGVGYSLTDYWRLGVSYLYEDTTISNISSEASDFISAQKGTTLTKSVIWSLSRNSLNNPFIPTSGSLNRFRIKYAGGFLGGELNFIEYMLSSDWYIPFIWKSNFLIGGDIKYGQPIGTDKLPLKERYMLGGLYSIRGFPYGYVGPEEITLYPTTFDPASWLGEKRSVIGGNKSIVLNCELQFPIVEAAKIRGVIFFDTGNAFQEGEFFDLRDLRKSWGLGFRWFSPIGPLRFEWGFPIDRREGEQKSIFEFGIGTFYY